MRIAKAIAILIVMSVIVSCGSDDIAVEENDLYVYFDYDAQSNIFKVINYGKLDWSEVNIAVNQTFENMLGGFSYIDGSTVKGKTKKQIVKSGWFVEVNGYQFLWTNFAGQWVAWRRYIHGLKTFSVQPFEHGYGNRVLMLWLLDGDARRKVMPAYDKKTGLHFTNSSGETWVGAATTQIVTEIVGGSIRASRAVYTTQEVKHGETWSVKRSDRTVYNGRLPDDQIYHDQTVLSVMTMRNLDLRPILMISGDVQPKQ